MNKTNFFLVSFLILVFISMAAVVKAIEVDFLFPCPPSEAGLGDCPEITSNTSNIPQYIVRFYQFGVGIAGILAVGMIVVGAIYRTISAGSQDKIREGNDMIKNAIWGIVLLLGSYIILQTINPRLVSLEILGVNQIENLPPLWIPERIPGEELPVMPTGTVQTSEAYRYCGPGVLTERRDCLYTDVRCPNLETCNNLNFTELWPIMKPDQCRWTTALRSECFLHFNTIAALTTLKNSLPEGFFQITEAFPPTDPHSNAGGHYNGCSADVIILPRNAPDKCMRVDQLIQAAQSAGLYAKNEYEGCGGKLSENGTNPHIHLKANNCP